MTAKKADAGLMNSIVRDGDGEQMLALELTKAHTAMRAARTVLQAGIGKAKAQATATVSAAVQILDDNLP